jgi:hypothetical protein
MRWPLFGALAQVNSALATVGISEALVGSDTVHITCVDSQPQTAPAADIALTIVATSGQTGAHQSAAFNSGRKRSKSTADRNVSS